MKMLSLERRFPLHLSCAWFDRLTMREVGKSQGARTGDVGDYICKAPSSLMVSLSNHAQGRCRTSEKRNS